jgi:hypothetical protein
LSTRRSVALAEAAATPRLSVTMRTPTSSLVGRPIAVHRGRTSGVRLALALR